MKILLSSHLFDPSVGGLETVSRLLAGEFQRQGHEVTVVTQTAAPPGDTFSYRVVRCPARSELLRWARWCDVFFHNNISLQAAWPLLLVRRPWIVAHHIWIARMDGRLAWPDRLKRFLLRFAANVSISRAIAAALPVPSEVIGDPYQDDVFVRHPEITRDRPLVYLGRLVSDKGVDLLLDALAQLRGRGLAPELSIIGSGPEEARLQQQAVALGLTGQVKFLGLRQGPELVRLLNQHQIMVAPSRWAEPFGVVALEGIACGCVVVASEQGGLKDAVGPCGTTFPNGDAVALAGRLAELLTQPEQRAALLANADAHLARHRRATVADAYLRLFSRVAGGRHLD